MDGDAARPFGDRGPNIHHATLLFGSDNGQTGVATEGMGLGLTPEDFGGRRAVELQHYAAGADPHRKGTHTYRRVQDRAAGPQIQLPAGPPPRAEWAAGVRGD